MRAVLIEDEQSAAENLKHLLGVLAPDIQLVTWIETVAEAIPFFQERTDYELIFMDIHLADGNSFEILKAAEPPAPIIFTTAYDQYAIQAFKVNSIDYLLKPIREAELRHAIQTFKGQQAAKPISAPQVEALLSLLQVPPKAYRRSFLIQKGDTFHPIPVGDFAFFFIENGVVRGTTHAGTTHFFTEKLEDLESDLNPDLFFRVNRQYLIQRSAIQSVSIYFNRRLTVAIHPPTPNQIVVSKANASKLKDWLDR